MRRFNSTLVILIVAGFGFYFLSQLVDNDKFEGVNPEMFENQQTGSAINQAAQNDEEDKASDKGVAIDELKAAILREGTGQAVKNGDQITVNYVGLLENGTKFDSSLDRGQPFTFTVGASQVIKGWDLGLIGMELNEVRRLYIPSEFAYGNNGSSDGSIPPGANLIFDIELLAIN